MTQTTGIDEVRDKALRKLGRNIVNFQKLEACLKYLVALSNVQGTAKTLPARQRQQEKMIRKKPLGDLANLFHKAVYGDGAECNPPPDLSEIWVSVSLKVEANAGVVKQQQRALAALVSERNKLIHHDLWRFDHNSVNDCDKLIEVLDAQNHRILQELAELKSLIDGYKTQIADLQSWVNSDDFLLHLQPTPNDA